MQVLLQFPFAGVLNSGPHLAYFSAMNKLVFLDFPVYQLFKITASASFNATPLLMVGPSLPFLMFLFVSTSSLSFLHATFTFLTTLFPSLTPFSVSSSPSFLTHTLTT